MNPNLPHAPLPTSRPVTETAARRMERDGFVDEEIVASMVAAPLTRRPATHPRDLALAADDTDFAGWNLPERAPAAVRESPFRLAPAPEIRRPAPPLVRKVFVPLPQPPVRRWWLAALAGVFSVLCAAAAALALAFSHSKLPPFQSKLPPPPPRGAEPRSPEAPPPW